MDKKTLNINLAKIKNRLKYSLYRRIIADRPSPRDELAIQFLRGRGIEIGALHLPLNVPPSVLVKYVDRMSVKDLRLQYPELNTLPLIEADILDNGEQLASFQDGSQDFVIACHLIEHTEDPIGTLKNWIRVIKDGGILYLAVPHRDFTFDKDRPLTTFEHLQQDHQNGPEWSRKGHFEEWAAKVNGLKGEDARKRVIELMSMNYSIHFHVWNEVSFLQFLTTAIVVENLPVTLEAFKRNGHEFLVILQKIS
jgi:predicted SAM-dependent methyltransferase